MDSFINALFYIINCDVKVVEGLIYNPIMLSTRITRIPFVVELSDRTWWFRFADYFLEDIVQILDFTPPPSDRKRKGGRDDEEGVLQGENDEEGDMKEVCISSSLTKVCCIRACVGSDGVPSFSLIDVIDFYQVKCPF